MLYPQPAEAVAAGALARVDKVHRQGSKAMLSEEARQAIRQRAVARAAEARVEQFLKQVADKDFALHVGRAIPVATSEELECLVERIYQAHRDSVSDEATAERLTGM